ncbi:hypothetical protein D3C72_1296270 [compost metagenome]
MPPVSVLAPLSVSVPAPVFSRLPSPETTPAYAPAAPWSKVRVVPALAATGPVMLSASPVIAPASSCVPPA